jgi:mannose-6-phosphate isomerase-like protein (cupin superfamily)
MNKVNLAEKFSIIDDYWNPRIAGQLNGQQVKLAKLKGSFVWHQHDNEDELFYVVKGSLVMELKDRTVVLNEGELFIVPKGTQHRPVAEDEVWVVLFEPASTLNTGDVKNERTKEDLSWI